MPITIRNERDSLACCMCAEICSGMMATEYQYAYETLSRICHQTPGFVTLPSVSPLREGHVLILPRVHVTNLAQLPPVSRETLVDYVGSVANGLAQRFETTVYFFEHGVTPQGFACGIDHAHFHIIPLTKHTIGLVDRRVDREFTVTRSSSLDDLLREARSENKSYLLRGTNLDSMRISFDDEIPSQYMRKIISEIDKKPDWDWKLLTGRPEFQSTCKLFS